MMITRRKFLQLSGLGITAAVMAPLIGLSGQPGNSRTNILWILAEDASPHLGCYGETTISTPNIDRLAAEGMRFTNAFVTAPVCSPARSALVTGMYQSVFGAHNHRSQSDEGKGEGHRKYFDSYELPEPVKMVSEYFQQAGYFATNGGPKSGYLKGVSLGKGDYNFIWDPDVYDSSDWKKRKKGQPFFAQIQLGGGKKRNAKVAKPVDPADVTLPPYYVDRPEMREDWAEYLNSILYMDEQVGQILDRLEKEGVAEDTVVVFMTDHGISHLRGKQFLYDEGIRVPLIIRWPGRVEPGSINEELTMQIDLAPTSLAMAGLSIPEHMHSRDIFTDDYQPRDYIVATRHRCDETIENIRCVRTKQFKYIRNYYPNRPHAQPNQYKDGKGPMQLMRKLFEEGELTELQASLFQPSRPAEELYDLREDPYETRNLIGNHAYQEVLAEMRHKYTGWLNEHGDLGLIPEPILEDLGLEYGNKYYVSRQSFYPEMMQEINAIIDLGKRGRAVTTKLLDGLQSEYAAVRYWAAYKLGNVYPGEHAVESALETAFRDDADAVRIAAARAGYRWGMKTASEQLLLNELQRNENHLVRHHAAIFLEELEIDSPECVAAMRDAVRDKYEYVRRVAKRFMNQV